MDKKLKALFDYQRFEKNEHLERVIRGTEVGCELSDDSLAIVAAAGEFLSPARKDDAEQRIREELGILPGKEDWQVLDKNGPEQLTVKDAGTYSVEYATISDPEKN